MEHIPRRVPGPQFDILDYLLPALEELPIIGDIIEIITGILGGDLGDLADWVTELLNIDGVNDLIALALGLLADLLDNVPIVGDTLAEILDNLAGGLNGTNATATTAQTTATQAASSVVTLQTTIFSVSSGRPLWDGPDPTGESTFPFLLLGGGIHSHAVSGLDISGSTGSGGGSGGAHSHGSGSLVGDGTTSAVVPTMAITQGVARGGFVRLAGGVEKRTVSWFGSGVTSITGFYVVINRQSANGDLVKVHESPNLAGQLTGTMAHQQYVIATGVDGYLGEPGDVLHVELRLVGAGTHSVMGLTTPSITPLPGFRPTKNGTTRNGGTGAAPSSIVDASVVYADAVPWIDVGADIGQTAAPRVWIDGFDRPGIGANWALRSTTGAMVIDSNTLAYGGTTDGTQGGVYVYPLSTDRARVQCQMETLADSAETRIVVCSNNIMTNYAALEMEDGELRIVTGTSISAVTVRESEAVANVDGDGFGIAYDPDDNTFYAYKNADPTPVLSWPDTTNVVTHGAGQRFVGAALKREPFQNPGRMTSWLAYDVVEEEP